MYDIEGLVDIGLMPWLLCSSEENGCVKVPRVRSTTLPSMSYSSYGRNLLPMDPGIEIDTNDIQVPICNKQHSASTMFRLFPSIHMFQRVNLGPGWQSQRLTSIFELSLSLSF
jgi:hypothetical protein